MKSATPDQEHFRARMRDEARLLGMLQDEQILGVSELVKVGGHDCVVMEYVEGIDLSDLVKVRTVPPRALAELGAELAGTMHRAHKAAHPQTGEPLHVIHRDVKPANVMVTSRGGVRLLDFGVARAAFASRESHTQGLVLGTLNYFPPEILAGADPTPAVDIYGLGLTMWECATGRDWGSPQVHRHRFERRVEQRLGEVGADYAGIVPILRRVLMWDPTSRPDGATVEAALLAAADTCTGEGLRTWARQIVPPMLQQRETEGRKDDLVGKTLPIEGTTPLDEPAPSPSLAPPPLAHNVRPIEPGVQRLESETFNDLAPPAAVRRRADDDVDLDDADAPAPRTDTRRAANATPPRSPPRVPAANLAANHAANHASHAASHARTPPRSVPRPPPRAYGRPATYGNSRIGLVVVAAVIGGALLGTIVFLLMAIVLWLATQ